MSSPDKRLSIMSDLEEFAFYGFPDFDDQQRLNYFVFTPDEWEVILHVWTYPIMQSKNNI